MKIKALWQKYKAYVGLILLLILPAVFIFFFVKEKEFREPVEAANSVEVETFFVDISGQVNKPGVYEVAEGAIVLDLIEKSGGLTPLADLGFVAKNLNLSQRLVPEDKFYIPQFGEMASSGGIGESSEKVNLNTASLEQLDSLPGIGESTAQKVIDARPFENIEDLKDVGGIGDAKFEEIKDKVTI